VNCRWRYVSWSSLLEGLNGANVDLLCRLLRLAWASSPVWIPYSRCDASHSFKRDYDRVSICVNSKLMIGREYLSLLSARSARGKRAFRAMSAGYEGRDFRRKSDCPSPVAYMYGSLRRGQRIEKRSDTTIVVLGQSSSDSRAGQERAWHGRWWVARGLGVSTSIHTIVSGRSGADS
jgi:hypothetical protein